jgi:uncharacterized membrane protein
MSLLSQEGVLFLLRWTHFLAGITWIGLLYYFNFVQIPYFAETKTAIGTGEFRKLVSRALWWFRYGALLTFLSGLVIILISYANGIGPMSSWGVKISAGATFGTLMFLNVWMIIWPKQSILLASAESVAGGGQPDPNAAAAGARAFIASRTNTLFSIPMLFFMGAASHLPGLGADGGMIGLAVVTALALALEANVIWGKKAEGISKILETTTGVIHAGLGLAIVSYLVMEFT